MSANEERPPHQVRISPRDGKYMFWIMSPNNRTLAKSTNNYRTRGAAEHAARRLVKSTGREASARRNSPSWPR